MDAPRAKVDWSLPKKTKELPQKGKSILQYKAILYRKQISKPQEQNSVVYRLA
jgi:hypothetical protein